MVATDDRKPLTKENQFTVALDTVTTIPLKYTSSNPVILQDESKSPIALPVIIIDPTTGLGMNTANPLHVQVYDTSSMAGVASGSVTNPLIVMPPPNAKYDSASGTAAGSTNTTATFTVANQLVVTAINIVTAAATTIIVKGTTSGRILATITLPTIAVAQTLPPMVFSPNIALTAETVTLTLSANFTSGTVSINVYGN